MVPVLALLVMMDPDRTYAFRMVEAGATSVLKDVGAIVLRTPEEFDKYLTRRKESNRKKPQMDWKTNQLVAIHLGSVPTAGYSLEVKRLVQKKPGTVVAEVALVRPPADAITAQVISYPYIVVRTERFAGKVDVQVVTP